MWRKRPNLNPLFSDFKFGFYSPLGGVIKFLTECELKISSLTIWKADINIGIYMTNTVSRCCLLQYKYQAITTFSYRECCNGDNASPQGCIIEFILALRAKMSYQVTHLISSDILSTWKCQTLQLLWISLHGVLCFHFFY